MPPQDQSENSTRLDKRILLVDDDPDTLTSVGDALRVLAGADVVTATSGADALIKLGREKLEVLVTDYRMPGMDGIELCAKARKMIRRLPIVMITAFNSDDLQDQAARAGICEVIPKPPDLEDLVAAIRDCCQAAAAGA